MLKSVGYIRTSTDRQELSLEVQERKVRGMAELKDAEMVEVICDEGQSGKDLDRPGAKRLMEMVRGKQVDMVIIAKVDRITRNLRDLAEVVELFNKKRVTLVSVAETIDTSTANGRMFVNFLGMFAQWERETIAERTSDALQAKKRRGERAGNIAYGWRLGEGRQLQEDPEEQRAIAYIRLLRGEGVALRGIASRINALGIKTRRGGAWKFQYVANVLGAETRA